MPPTPLARADEAIEGHVGTSLRLGASERRSERPAIEEDDVVTYRRRRSLGIRTRSLQ
jgi:hypothetical protein